MPGDSGPNSTHMRKSQSGPQRKYYIKYLHESLKGCRVFRSAESLTRLDDAPWASDSPRTMYVRISSLSSTLETALYFWPK